MLDWLWKYLKPVLFLLDAEKVHRALVVAIRLGIRLGGSPLRVASGSRTYLTKGVQQLPVVFGLEFRSRVGLAAGFDKDAEILEGLADLGFGYAEIGTVTPRPQSGNPKPRLFREPARQAIFNRMGFNGCGAVEVAQKLAAVRRRGLAPGFRVGVNIGKNKDTALENAAQDYRDAIIPLIDLADYVVINVSSPNTPGLRSLQTAEHLRPIIEAVVAQLTKWKKPPPLLLKLAPELTDSELEAIVDEGQKRGVGGWVMSNTLGGNWVDGLPGGWSGAPLEVISRERLVALRKLTQHPIISVGGIMTVEEAKRRVDLGADLIQIYSGWIFNGPRFPARLASVIESLSL